MFLFSGLWDKYFQRPPLDLSSKLFLAQFTIGISKPTSADGSFWFNIKNDPTFAAGEIWLGVSKEIDPSQNSLIVTVQAHYVLKIIALCLTCVNIVLEPKRF